MKVLIPMLYYWYRRIYRRTYGGGSDRLGIHVRIVVLLLLVF